MASLMQEYIGGLIGTVIQLVAFMLVYSCFTGINISWNIVGAFALTITMIFAPINYIAKKKQEI